MVKLKMPRGALLRAVMAGYQPPDGYMNKAQYEQHLGERKKKRAEEKRRAA
jgi:hypothetical protein